MLRMRLVTTDTSMGHFCPGEWRSDVSAIIFAHLGLATRLYIQDFDNLGRIIAIPSPSPSPTSNPSRSHAIAEGPTGTSNPFFDAKNVTRGNKPFFACCPMVEARALVLQRNVRVEHSTPHFQRSDYAQPLASAIIYKVGFHQALNFLF